jgi:RNA polymerase sigma factor (sigma-70 family)
MNINQELANFYNDKDLPPLLTIEQEQELGDKVQHGEPDERDAAAERLITSNLLLVMKIAKSYAGCLKGNGGVGAKDLVNEGNMGLMIAARKYDPKKSKFSTYASFWIRQSIIRTLCNKSRIIRLPTNLVQKSLHVFKYIDEYKDKHGTEPEAEDIAKGLNINLPIVSRILSSNYTFVTLDSPLGRGESSEGRSTVEIIEDVSLNNPFEATVINDNAEVIRKTLDTLKPRERHIIEHRFGLNDRDVQTLEQIGETFGVTRERIRQIEFETMRRLRRAFHREYNLKN